MLLIRSLTLDNCRSVRKLITEMIKKNQPVIKARLVARRLEDMRDQRTDSSNCANDSARLMVILIAARGWFCNSTDNRAAFLQGDYPWLLMDPCGS